MSEEEIIRNIKHWLNMTEYHRKEEYHNSIDNYIKGILDLYNKEKEKNKELEKLIKINHNIHEQLRYERDNYYIAKDKIREKIKEIENKQYILSSKDSEIQILEELLEEGNLKIEWKK